LPYDRTLVRHGGLKKWQGVTIRIELWNWYIWRIRLTIIEGYYETEKEIDKVLTEAGEGKEGPKYFDLICRTEEAQGIVNALMKVMPSRY